VSVVNPQGLHARPISSFVKLSATFVSKVTVRGPGGVADGRSVLSMMSLNAPAGSELEIRAAGSDAALALAALVELVRGGFGEA